MTPLHWRRRKSTPPSEATRARLKAERDLQAVKAETPKYRALAESLIEIQRVNHLGMRAHNLLRGEK
jgi:hypothetical protein